MAGSPGLAAGWYIALSTDELRSRRRPVALDLFGRRLVAWRDGDGRAAIMPRHCPHLGASLAVGKVVDGLLRCPFHHWRFDATGACAMVPGLKRPPRTVDRGAYPVEERYGYVWAWYGGAEPVYPLPEVPALAGGRAGYLGYRFCHTTSASPRRVLENAFDHRHFITLHGVRSAEEMRLTVLSDPAAAAENGPPIAESAWTGALLESRGLELPWAIRALGVATDRFDLLVDGWPGGQRLTFFLDGRVVVKELLGVTPVTDGRTVIRGWSLVRRSGNPARDAMTYLAYRAYHRFGTEEDLAIYRDVSDTSGTVAVRSDQGVLRFRQRYAQWIGRVEPDRAQAI